MADGRRFENFQVATAPVNFTTTANTLLYLIKSAKIIKPKTGFFFLCCKSHRLKTARNNFICKFNA